MCFVSSGKAKRRSNTDTIKMSKLDGTYNAWSKIILYCFEQMELDGYIADSKNITVQLQTSRIRTAARFRSGRYRYCTYL